MSLVEVMPARTLPLLQAAGGQARGDARVN
jgi:hypothetical protein